MRAFGHQRGRLGAIAPLVCMLLSGLATASVPLHQRIDQLIESAQFGPPAPTAADPEFLRRTTLALTGQIPTSAEARAFFADGNPGKRLVLIDRLLASPAYARHLATTFDVMLMERRPDVSVPTADWRKYLETSFAQNKPFDQLAREILSSDGSDPALRPAAKFTLDRNLEPNLLARDTARLFFARDLQCAQCHDHPLIEGYRQAEYFGLYSFFSRSSVFADPEKKINLIADKAEGEVTYTSVFKKKYTHTSQPQVPGGQPIPDAPVPPGQEYKVKPADKVRPIPTYSRRLQLATAATTSNPHFNRNIANRLWMLMMGKGLIDPPDLDHPRNPAVYPPLLDLLAQELAATKYDTRAFLRELAQTKAFQRTFDLPATVSQQVQVASQQLPALQAELEKLNAALKPKATALEQHDERVASVTKPRMEAAAELTKANAAMAEAKKAMDAAAAAVATSQGQLSTRTEAANLLSDALSKTQEALKRLPTDKEITDAIAILQRRAAQFPGELAALKSTFDNAAVQLKTAQEKHTATTQPVTIAGSKLASADQQVAATWQQQAQVFAAWYAHDQAVAAAEKRLDAARTLAEYGNLASAAQVADAEVKKATDTLATGKQVVLTLGAAVAQKQSEVVPFQKAADEANRILAEQQQLVSAKHATIQAIAEAAAKSEAALVHVPGNAEIVEAISAFKSVAAALAPEAAELQKVLTTRQAAANDAAAKLASAQAAHQGAVAELGKANQQVTALDAALKTALEKARADHAAANAAYQKVSQLWTRQLATSPLEPLSPEQLAWATMQALGIVDQHRPGAEAEVIKKLTPPPATQPTTQASTQPATKPVGPDPALVAIETDKLVYERLKGNEAHFVRLFSPGPGQPQDFFASVDQALFFDNDGLLRGWLAPAGGTLVERLNKLQDPKALAEELYLSILTRPPTDPEIAAASQHLAARVDKRVPAIQDLVWALISSAEFRFRH